MFAFLKKVSENEDLFGMGPTLKLPLVSTLRWMTLDHVYGANANKLLFLRKAITAMAPMIPYHVITMPKHLC